MHRFHLPADHWESATLPADESHHCVNVLRLEAGERISVFDGAGREASGTIVEARAKGVVLKISGTAKTPPPPCAIVLVQAVPKGKNMDLIVQLEAAELAKKREKWQAVALEACKQCGQNHLPKVGNPASPKDFLEHSDRNELMLIASLQPDARPLKAILAEFQAVHSHLPRSVTVLVGPEGDFTPAELALAKTNGCIPMTLGPIILRTETAAIYCLSVLAHELFQPASR
jgi:16S rRNA (uracil1498-N3)-methyltransferase